MCNLSSQSLDEGATHYSESEMKSRNSVAHSGQKRSLIRKVKIEKAKCVRLQDDSHRLMTGNLGIICCCYFRRTQKGKGKHFAFSIQLKTVPVQMSDLLEYFPHTVHPNVQPQNVICIN